MKKILLIILVLTSLTGFNQFAPTSQSNNSLSFQNFLAGVDEFTLPQFLVADQTKFYSQQVAESAAYHWLQNIGFKKTNKANASLCYTATVKLRGIFYSDGLCQDLQLVFTSCNGDSWVFKNNERVELPEYGNLGDDKGVFERLFSGMYGYTKPTFNSYYSYTLKGSEKTNYTEQTLKNYYSSNKIDAIEGIYELSFANKESPKYRLGLIKNGDDYNLVYLSGAENYVDWKEGDMKAKLTPTSTSGLYKTKWSMGDKTDKDAFAGFDGTTMKIIMGDRDPDLYIKMYPSSTDKIHSNSGVTASGTGFAVNSMGYIITNYHVIEDATEINIRGIKGDFNKLFTAKVVVSDKSNDLALLKISDVDFKGLGGIPYAISFKNAGVGNDVYALGYPLRASMGDEVKLTNGIISANSGFEGSLNQYQISVPVQPGNSGGPLINLAGNIVGVVNAKHLGTENVSYAIKGSFLSNLIESSGETISLPASNLLTGKTLSQQVQLVKKFVYIIEVQ